MNCTHGKEFDATKRKCAMSVKQHNILIGKSYPNFFFKVNYYEKHTVFYIIRTAYVIQTLAAARPQWRRQEF